MLIYILIVYFAYYYPLKKWHVWRIIGKNVMTIVSWWLNSSIIFSSLKEIEIIWIKSKESGDRWLTGKLMNKAHTQNLHSLLHTNHIYSLRCSFLTAAYCSHQQNIRNKHNYKITNCPVVSLTLIPDPMFILVLLGI